MNDFESLVLLMSVAVLLVSLAQKIQIPYAIALVLGGAVLSFIPGIDFSYIDPNLLLTIVLPPILYYAAFWTSVRDFKKHAAAICSLAFGLVVVTTIVIGMLFKWCLPEVSWPLAFAFGAIVSPPDAAAATSILKRFPLGQKLITILEGESLVNDASALVLYKIAVTAILSSTFSFVDAGIDFACMSVGGILLGTTLGYVLQACARRFLDPVLGAFSSFLIPYINYILACELGVSGVLTVVACGVVSSRIILKHQTSLRRMLGRVTWDMYIILLNCFIFILIGSQLDEQTKHMSWDQMLRYTGFAFLLTVMMFIIRLVWSCVKSTLLLLRSRSDPKIRSHLLQFLQDGVIIGWVGMRGIVSLTAALALPLTLDNGKVLEGRSEVIYMVFCVILFTLIIPGLSLGKVISWLNLPTAPLDETSTQTRKSLAAVALEEIKNLHANNSVSDEEHSLLVDYFNSRVRLWERINPENSKHTHLEIARKKVVQAQRAILVDIWEKGQIDDKILAQIEHELDVEETQTARAEI